MTQLANPDFFHACYTAARERGYDNARAQELADKAQRYADAAGHEHLPAGSPEGGEFTGNPEHGQSPNDMAAKLPETPEVPQIAPAPKQVVAFPTPDQMLKVQTKLVNDNMGLVTQAVAAAEGKYKGRDPHDLLSNAQMALWRAAQSWDESKGPFENYANVAISNSMKRGKNVQEGQSLSGKEGENIDVEQPTKPGSTAINDERAAKVQAAVQQMTGIEKIVAERLLQNQRPVDIANALGRTPGNISKIYDRVVQQIQGLVPAEHYQEIVEYLLRYADDETRERGPWKKRSPRHAVASAANRLQSLEDHKAEYDADEIADVIGEIAEHFDVEAFKEVCRKFGLKGGQTKADLVRLLVDRIGKEEADHYAADASGHEHVGKGVPEGGQFTGGAGQSPNDMAAKLKGKKEKPKPQAIDESPLAKATDASSVLKIVNPKNPSAPAATWDNPNPIGFDQSGFLPGVNGETFTKSVVGAVQDQRAKNAFQRLTLPQLYETAKQAEPSLTYWQFQNGVAKLHKDRLIRLGPFTQGIATHPAPNQLMPLDREFKWYAEPA